MSSPSDSPDNPSSLDSLLSEARAETSYLTTILNAVPNLIMIKNADLEFVLVNRATLEFFGVDRDRLLGSRLTDFVDSPAAHETEQANLHALQQGKPSGVQESEYVHPATGETHWYHERYIPIRVANPLEERELLVIATDITDRKRKEQQRKKIQQNFHHLTENIEEVFWINNAEQDEILYASPAYETIWGRSRDDLYKNPSAWKQAVHPDDREKVEKYQRAQSEGEYDVEYRIRRPDGEIRWIHDKGFPVREEGEVRRIVGIAEDITDRVKLKNQLQHQALHDQLTGLPNRSLLDDRLTMAMNRCERQKGWPFAVVFLDLDQFKEINETYGHDFGDQLLQTVAEELESVTRDQDTVARFGGDEFVFVLEDIEGREDVDTFLQRIHDRFERGFELEGRDVHVSASTGVVLAESAEESPEELLRDADVAMFRAKEDQGNTHRYFSREFREKNRTRRTLKQDLNRAYDREEFEVHFQPIINLSDGDSFGLEALLRWNHPDRGLLLPQSFLPQAMESEILPDIEWHVIQQVLSRLEQWNDSSELQNLDWVSINVSPQYFLQSRAVQKILDRIETARIDPGMIRLELTEKTAIQKEQITQDNLEKMRRKGLLLALDDFGTGYSSLEYLQKLPIDMLKIDRSFISGNGDQEDRRNILELAVELARAMDVKSIVEGIETEQQLEEVRGLNCDYGQGFLFSEARPAGELAEVARNRAENGQSTR